MSQCPDFFSNVYSDMSSEGDIDLPILKNTDLIPFPELDMVKYPKSIKRVPKEENE